jgi:hypothetical protein
LTLILDCTGILEAGAVFHSGDVAAEHAGSASVKAANENILAVIFILVVHSRYLGSLPFQSRHILNKMNRDPSLPTKLANESKPE